MAQAQGAGPELSRLDADLADRVCPRHAESHLSGLPHKGIIGSRSSWRCFVPQVGVFVPVSAIFPEVTPDFPTFCSLVRSLSRTDTLFWCARLNLILSNPENRNRIGNQEYGLHLFFDQEQIGRLNRFTGEHGGPENVMIFLRSQLLELMRWTCLLAEDHQGDGNTFNDPDVRRRFLQAALIASDLWGDRTWRGKLSSDGSVPEARRRAMAAARQGVAANTSATELMQQLARGVSIYRESFPREYPPAEGEFQTATGISLDQYLACICGLAIHFTNITPQSAAQNPGGFRPDTLGANLTPEIARAVGDCVAFESQTADELREGLWGGKSGSDGLTGTEPFNYKPLRDRPILRTPDGRAIILDPVFFSEKTTVGPLFTLVKAAAAKGKDWNRVFGAFGTSFERYVNSLLRTMYPSAPPPFLDRLICNPRARLGEDNVEIADACMFDAAEAVLFEAKGVFVREDAAQGDSIDAYLNELRKKYSASAGSKKDRQLKGAAQLGQSIRRLALGELPPLGPDWARVRQVFPVLVVYDVSLNSPGHAEFFEEELRKALAPDEVGPSGFMRKGGLTVAPLTLMTIEDLENLESSVQHFRLVDFLRDYASTTRGGRRDSLHDFMAGNQKKYKLIHSRELAGRAIKVLEETGRMMFPGMTFPPSNDHKARQEGNVSEG